MNGNESDLEAAAANDPWQAAWDLTMEPSTSTRVRGVRDMAALLRRGYELAAAEAMCAPVSSDCGYGRCSVPLQTA